MSCQALVPWKGVPSCESLIRLCIQNPEISWYFQGLQLWISESAASLLHALKLSSFLQSWAGHLAFVKQLHLQEVIAPLQGSILRFFFKPDHKFWNACLHGPIFPSPQSDMCFAMGNEHYHFFCPPLQPLLRPMIVIKEFAPLSALLWSYIIQTVFLDHLLLQDHSLHVQRDVPNQLQFPALEVSFWNRFTDWNTWAWY